MVEEEEKEKEGAENSIKDKEEKKILVLSDNEIKIIVKSFVHSRENLNV